MSGAVIVLAGTSGSKWFVKHYEARVELLIFVWVASYDRRAIGPIWIDVRLEKRREGRSRRLASRTAVCSASEVRIGPK